jgi:tocopherol cyclase
MGLINYLKGIKNPAAYHGSTKPSEFFEGWYIKLVSEDESTKLAVIPGIFKGLKGDESRNEAFVQLLDGTTGRSWYQVYPLEQFSARSDRFEVQVGPNYFDSSSVILELPNLKGKIQYLTPLDPWPVTLASPGIMGWYGLLPFMECFHGIVSFGHLLSGSLEFEGGQRNFDFGRGYIEKDWGQSFPAGYIWLHTNHIDGHPEASLVASVAIIPWIKSSFRGFIIGFRHSGKLHRWTTYNGSKELKLEVKDDSINWELKGPDGILKIQAERKGGGLLHAPLREAMHQRVEETLDARLQVTHTNLSGQVLIESFGTSSGMEVFGNLERMMRL